jgi:uncharacterized protein (TIGR00730 family)
MTIRSLVVFCGSRPGNNPVFVQHAEELGKLIALKNYKLIYGGSKNGLMGAIAGAALALGGKVVGLMPQLLVEWEQQHEGLTELQVVTDMHTRKKMMYDLGDAAIILPGGFGTLDELFEMITWNQLKIHDKKILILNSAGFYDHLSQHLRRMEDEGFLHAPVTGKVIFCETPEELFSQIE